MRSIYDDLSELPFEGLSEATALRLAEDVMGRAIPEFAAGGGVMHVKMPNLDLGGGLVLRNARLRLLRYEGSFDVEINFVLRDAEGGPLEGVIERLHKFAMDLSRRHNVMVYYAGLEPASDEDTRFFTGPVRGPYW